MKSVKTRIQKAFVMTESGCIAAGPKLGKWIILPPQLIVMIGLGITYSVTGGSSLHNFYGIVCKKNEMGECHSAGLSVWIIVFSAIHIFLIQVCCMHTFQWPMAEGSWILSLSFCNA